jgi:hypothetical protein
VIALNISDRDRRVLVLGGASMLLIAGLGRGIPALRRWSAERQRQAVESAELLAHREWLAHNAHGLDREMARVRRELATYDSALVEGESPSTASARLAELVSDAVADTDAKLASIRMSADSVTKPGELGHVVAYASVSGDLASLAAVLKALEEGPQLLSVSELSIAELVVDGLYRRATRVGTTR